MAIGHVSVRVPVRAPASAVWDAVTDWEAQGEWMPATRVRAADGDGPGVDGRDVSRSDRGGGGPGFGRGDGCGVGGDGSGPGLGRGDSVGSSGLDFGVGRGGGRGVGGRIEAFTGFGRFGILDTMVVTEWRPPTWCAVDHTGRVIRGTGAFSVQETPDGVLFTWSEDLELPAGALGDFAWKLISPFVRLTVHYALTRLAHSVEAKQVGLRRSGAGAA